MKVYKVVSFVSNNYYSCFSPIYYRRIYRIGITTKAIQDSVGIFVFKSKSDAKHFSFNVCNPVILECETKKVKKIKKIAKTGFIYDTFSEFYRLRKNKKFIKEDISIRPPKGTYICDSLKPLREL